MEKEEAAELMYEALQFIYMTIEFRDGLKRRMDLVTRDERNKLLAALQSYEDHSQRYYEQTQECTINEHSDCACENHKK